MVAAVAVAVGAALLLVLVEGSCSCDLFGLPLCLSFNLSFSPLSVFSLCSSSLSYLSVHTYT